MILCSNCGLELDNSVDFCPQCGTQVIKKQETILEADIHESRHSNNKRIVIDGLHDKKEYGKESERIEKIKQSGWVFSDINPDIDTLKPLKKSISHLKQDTPAEDDKLKDEKLNIQEIQNPQENKDITVNPTSNLPKEEEDIKSDTKLQKNVLLGGFISDAENVNPEEKAENKPKKNELVVPSNKISPKNLLLAKPKKDIRLFNQEEVIKENEGRKKKDKKESVFKTVQNKLQKTSETDVKEKNEVQITNVSTKELLEDYSDEIMIGSKEDVAKILEKEAERERLLEKSKETIQEETPRRKRNLFSAMISGFADEEEDEKIKAEISKSKRQHKESKLSSVIVGSEGRKKKRNNNLDIEEERQDQISQVETNEKEYDDYYEFVMPLDDMKFERRSSFKAHIIGIFLIIAGAIGIAFLIASTGIGKGLT